MSRCAWVGFVPLCACVRAGQPNVRKNCAFFLLTGGAQFPLVVGASNVVVMNNPNFPSGVRLSVVDPTHMQVCWVHAAATCPPRSRCTRRGGRSPAAQVMWNTQLVAGASLYLGTQSGSYPVVLPATSTTFAAVFRLP